MRSAVVQCGAPVSCEEEHTAVPWWSFTKTVLAAAALALVREGRIALDSRLEDHQFTLRQLLRHQAGLTDYGHLGDYHVAVARHEEPWSVEEMLARTDARRLRYSPGQGWEYSNIGYLYIRQLIEREAEEDLDTALHRLLLAPLDVTGPRVVDSREELQSASGNPTNYDPKWVYHGLLVGSLVAAATLLDRVLSGRFLPAPLLNAMRDSYHFPLPFPGRPWIGPGYGLGLMTGTTGNKAQLAGHTGAGPGSVIAVYHSSASAATAAAFFPGSDQAVVEREVVRLLEST